MNLHGPGVLAGLFLAALLVTAAGTALALRYARWRKMLDLPGQRRSHSTATPRGGGIAIVVAVVLFVPLMPWPDARLPAAFAVSLSAIALVGWIDDHRPLSARVRLAVHLAAAMLWLAISWPLADVSGTGLSLLMLVVVVFWLAGCVNAWNFMDGSNGLVASQSLWLGGMLAWMLLGSGQPGAWGGVALVLAGACAGFLPFNFPRAAIFMGDVGSGSLGWICGVLLLAAVVLMPERAFSLVLLPSALLVDAGLTLAWRMISRRRWYTAHREHLYQWLIRSGRSHAQVAWLYMAWNLLVVLPACIAIDRWSSAAPFIAVLPLVAAISVWWRGKSRLLARARAQGRTL